MTQVQSSLRPDASLENSIRLAHDRSARGNATRRDWQRVAEMNPDVAYRELRTYLRRAYAAGANRANPYERQARIPGAVIGFVAGTLLMIAVWIFLPYARENWMERSLLRDVATGIQFLSTLFVPLGALLGVRWSRNQSSERVEDAPGLTPDATFEEMLEAFEKTQNVGRARVY